MWNIRQVQLKSILLNDSSVTNNFPFRRQMTEFWEGLFAAVAHTPVQKSKQDLDLAMIRLRQLNRQSTLRTHEIKQLVSVDRERLDELNLEWQNLDYERRHLEKELDCYLNSKTVYQTIPLHSLEEYLCLTGGNSSMEVEDSAEAEDDHELMMKRLNFELIERKRYGD
jgi:hypothetical protein